MPRRSVLILVSAALLGALAVTGCTQFVRVETGELVTCTYGEAVTNTVKVVEVPADQAANYTVVKTTVTCDRHRQLEDLYAQAQAAILASDLETARARLAQIVALDATFRRARTQLDAIEAGNPPVVDTGSTAPSTDTTAGADGQLPVGPVANLSGYVPETLTGYEADPIIADVFSLSRQYVPEEGAATDSLVIVVEQYKDAKSARAAITRGVVPKYGFNVSKVSVSGRELRFGTDGKRFATLAWNEGGILVVIEASSADRKPADLKSHLVAIAGGIVK